MQVPCSPPEIAADAAFHEHHNSVVQIIDTKGQGSAIKKEFLGSGFIIGKKAEATESCLVLTCDHVLQHNYDSLRMRLSNTNEDLEATAVFCDGEFDLGVLIVQGNFNVDRPTIGLTDGTAQAIAVGTLVALVSYYNPIGLKSELGSSSTPLFSVVAGAYGGYIMGAPIDENRNGIKLSHGCYGIKGCSGGPLICHDTKLAIGVFQSSINQVHMAISTETVHIFLKLWLSKNNIQVEDTDTILETISKCGRLY